MLRIIPFEGAKAMIQKGIMCGVFSDFFLEGHPKYIWYVGDDGEVYEAKTDLMTPGVYHGYRLEEEDNVREYIAQTWKDRCPKLGR